MEHAYAAASMPVWRVARRSLLTIRSHANAAATEHQPIVIVGAGPSGMTLALWLSRFGVRSVILEKTNSLTQHPQAHYINNRTMEVLRPLWGLSAEVARCTPPLDEWRAFRYCFTMTGELLGRVDHFKGRQRALDERVSPEPVAHVPQHRLLPLMLQKLQEPHSLCTIRWGHTVQSCRVVLGGGVQVDVKVGQDSPYTLHTPYLVAGDGANSSIRQQLGIGMSGQQRMQHLINVHFTSPLLGAQLRGRMQRPGAERGSKEQGQSGLGADHKAAMLYFVFNSDVVTVVVAHDLQQGEFVAQVPFYPPLQSPADFTEAKCRALIAAAVGGGLEALPDLCVRQVRPWVMSALVADRYQYPPTGHPRVFLIGDAAHCFPPAGGFGLNTGVQDAHNLAWKLALAVQPRDTMSSAGASAHMGLEHLLGSYQVERRPVAHTNCQVSLVNWQEAVAVPSQLGLNLEAATLLHRAVTAVPLPGVVSKVLLEAGLALGRTATTGWGALRAWQTARLAELFRTGDTLRLQFPREDLGFVYPPSPGAAIARESLPMSPPRSSSTSAPGVGAGQGKAGRTAPYIPSSAPGCRLPHCWLSPLPSSFEAVAQLVPGLGSRQAAEGSWVSTLDLTAGPVGERPHVTLFVDAAHVSPWVHAAHRLQGEGCGGAGIQVIAMWPDSVAAKGAMGSVGFKAQEGPISSIGGAAQAQGCTVLEMVDVQGMWYSTMGLVPGSVLLCRPDGHVGWRCGPVEGQPQESREQAWGLLATAMDKIFGGA